MFVSRTRTTSVARRRAFTFIEIMVVVLIIGLLMAVVVPNITAKMARARVTTTQATIRSIATAVGSFAASVGRLPTTGEGLEALITRPDSLSSDEWGGPYLEDTPVDGWNRELIYRVPGEKGAEYDLISAGPDKREGTPDDITNERRRRRTESADAD